MAFLVPLASPVLGLINTVIERLIPDKEKQAEAKLAMQAELMKGDLQLTLAQIDVNAKEAASQSTFVAGWRPFIGWVGGFAIAYTYIVQPFLGYIIKVFSPGFLPPPTLNTSDLMVLITGMLGLAAARSYDKAKSCDVPVGKATG
jgi:hypothetical protein